MPNQTFRLPVTRRSSLVLVATLAIAACTGSSPSASPPVGATGSPGASPSASGAPSASPDPTVGAIDHKTGAKDVVLRIETGGGFVPMEFNASQAPGFTLYGDGVIVFQPVVPMFPEPDSSGVTHLVKWRTAKLDETQVQELLEFAITNGGLGTARDVYMEGGIADAPSTTFTLKAGGLDKTVTVSALSEDPRPGPDALARTAFAKLAKRLQDFDEGGTIPSDVYVPDRYRGILIERDAQPGVMTTSWPWPNLTAADFPEGVPGGPGPFFPHRTLTADEVAALKLTDIEGGVQGLVLKAPTGKLYSFILRPLLVDEPD